MPLMPCQSVRISPNGFSLKLIVPPTTPRTPRLDAVVVCRESRGARVHCLALTNVPGLKLPLFGSSGGLTREASYLTLIRVYLVAQKLHACACACLAKKAFQPDTSHEVIITELIVVVSSGVGIGRPRHSQGRLRLGRLGLLAALLLCLLLLELLIAESRHGAGDLLDLVTGQLLGQLLRELDEEQRVVSLLGVAGDNGGHHLAELFELCLGLGVEKSHRGQVDQVVGVLGVRHAGPLDDCLAGGRNTTDITTEEILGVLEISLLLGLSKAGPFGGFILVGLVVRILLVLLLTLCNPLLKALCLGLLVGLCFGLDLGLRLGGLLCLLALNLRVLSCVPGV